VVLKVSLWGTGKSTTIFHIVNSRLPPGARVLVTCSRNVAVESLAQKLSQARLYAINLYNSHHI
jgi:hypothetical protein